MLVLGIETSCDETAAAVVRNGREIISSVLTSQIETHQRFGGIVPEIASREHLDKIVPIVNEAFERASIGARDVDGIAVTVGPGLVGSLLVGVSYAKAMAFALSKPIVGVNHIEGHIYSVAFENPPIEYPAVALIVSGGHTNVFFIPEPGKYKVVARTRDDAAGEAFDKVARMMGLGYPGGPIIERLARDGNPKAVRFAIPKMGDGLPDFSFSGLKTAVTKYVRESGLQPLERDTEPSQDIKDLAASFQRVVVQSSYFYSSFLGIRSRFQYTITPFSPLPLHGTLPLLKAFQSFARELENAVHGAVDDAFMALPPYTRISEDEVHELGLGVRNCSHRAL